MTWTAWLLIGAALVFFMQCGFAMVETGFTRAKNTGNILFKNFVDFCIGCVCFLFLGFGLMMGVDYVAGFIGVPNLDIFGCFETLFHGDPASADYAAATSTAASFVFNLVFCATAATIVSGAMAERTRFLAYCIYSAMISLVVYPIEAGWVWNSQGWLMNLGVGFVDFAGSAAIHTVGGTASLIGIIFVGARIGKFERDENGKVIKVNVIQGHNMTIGALGVLILWFGWYGFNGAAATEEGQLARIFVTTTIAPSVALLVTMIYTWIRNKKPDLVMSMNATLAGLVGITAGCSNLDIIGALVVGVVSGFLVMGGTWLLEQKLHLDDCVGAVPVHFLNGVWGTIAVGFFDVNNGLFYSGNAELFGIQTLGLVTIVAWTAVCMTIFFAAIKYIPVMVKYKTVKPAEVFAYAKTWNGLRCNPEEELVGLDISEHGLSSSYPDFVPSVPSYDGEGEDVDISAVKPVAIDLAPANETKYTKVTIITAQEKFLTLKDAMAKIGVTGMTVSNVMGCGTQAGKIGQYRGVKTTMRLIPKVQVEIVVSTVDPKLVVAVAQKVLDDGKYGAGKIFVTGIENVMRVRTGETGVAALTNEPEPVATK
ncbi:MAG TPA: ammonium transporter [Candidatus Coproplasma excrementigallinarum]|uniref:Ammonium transporter n=1 Tax=Candidatus Coproplasma excrementigallinarum TaxID=2840747 RepID=A0A9D1MK71_9FIRM|nr:ammonium transporter [Candidatus Coproplasma excrementigallinarum]